MIHSFFVDIPLAAPDVIFGVTEAFRGDPTPEKVNLSVGVYQDGKGMIPLLESIKRAAAQWFEAEDSKTYLPIDGLASYNKATQELLFGANSSLLSDKRVVTVQSVGGTGALRLGAEIIERFSPVKSIYISDPTWENHRVVFEATGLTVKSYPYYDPATCGLKKAEMLESMRSMPKGSALLLHACCHNPTGVDLDEATWREVVDVCIDRELLPFIDCAYQGFAKGLEEDSAPIRLFAEKGLNLLVANSYSKSFSMYRERTGALSVVAGSQKEATSLLSQIKPIVRSIYSNPPSYGAQLISIVLHNPELRTLWEKELTEMRERIHAMRKLFSAKLAQSVPNRDFSFILKQQGMFSYSGLSTDVVRILKERHHIYALDSGRICVAAMNEGNIGYICDSIAEVLCGG